MLNSWYFKIYRLQSTWAYYLAGCPFVFNYSQRRVYVTTGAYMRYAGFMFILVSYTAFLLIQVIRLNIANRNNDFQYYYCYALTLCGVVDILAGIAFIRTPELSAVTITEFWNVLDDIASK